MAPTNDSTSGHLVSAGLFLATALASQWLQHHMRKQEDLSEDDDDDDESSYEKYYRLRKQRQRMRRHREQLQEQARPQNNKIHAKAIWRPRETDDDDGYQEDEEPTNSDALGVEFRDYYKLRRLEDRLSFENLRPLIQAPEIPSENGLSMPPSVSFANPQPFHNITPQQHPTQRKSKSQRHRARSRRVDSAVDREDEYDFLPKNSNWNHFEKYNEEDVQNGLVVPGSGRYHEHHFQAFSNGYDQHYANDAGGTIDESDRTAETAGGGGGDGGETSSDSSEEPQFVWTDAVREKRTSKIAADATIQPMTLAARGPTMSAELPVPNRPVRSMTGDSQATEPTGNSHSNGEGRPFLRHASSAGTTDSPTGWLPQRFPPRATASIPKARMLRRSPSGQSFGSAETSSGISSDPLLAKGSNLSQHKSSDDVDFVSSSHRSARAQYNAKIMPAKVVMCRHGESMGNIDEALYSTTPDNAMPLTKLGWEQARKAGRHLKNNVLTPLESVHFIVSPYARTVETFHGIVSAWCDPDSPEFASIPNREMRLKAWYGRLLEMGLTWHEDPRIREQDFGNYQDPELIRKAKRDRHRFGTFYYRFPHGESASDVFDRVSTFLDSLWRSFDMNRSRNYVLVTHGISIRVLLARYFRYTIHQFNMLSNPRNCEMVVLAHDGFGRLRLQGRWQLHLKERKVKGGEGDDADNSKESSNGSKSKGHVWEVDEYKFHKRLRILPQAAIRKVDIRISYNDGGTKQASS